METGKSIDSYVLPEGLDAIVIPDGQTYQKEHFLLQKSEYDIISYILLPEGMIKNRAEKLAEKIYWDYVGQELHLFCILNGAYQFFTDLFFHLNKFRQHHTEANITLIPHFIKISSYVNDKSTANKKGIHVPITQAQVKGHNCLIIEDALDSGASLKVLDDEFKALAPKSLEYSIIFYKRNPENLVYNFVPKYTGFSLPNEFILGYGMDFNEQFRDLQHLGVMSPEAIQKFKIDV